LHGYSITSSARAKSVGGTSRPSAFATAGFAPRKIFSIKSPGAAEVDEGHRADGRRDVPTGVENSYFS
jgi:hypothetical protein